MIGYACYVKPVHMFQAPACGTTRTQFVMTIVSHPLTSSPVTFRIETWRALTSTTLAISHRSRWLLRILDTAVSSKQALQILAENAAFGDDRMLLAVDVTPLLPFVVEIISPNIILLFCAAKLVHLFRLTLRSYVYKHVDAECT